MTTSDETERVLVTAFGDRRDEASFRALYHHCSPTLFAMAVRLSQSSSDAEDLLQETWSRAVRLHDRYSGSSRYTTWLVGILANCAREARRGPGREQSADGDVVELATTPVTGTTHDLEAALAKLPDGYREIVILHDVNGYAHREIAQMLGIEEGTSKSQLARGRARMRTLLKREPESNKQGNSS